MPSIICRIFLFVLLGLDWVADPSVVAPAVQTLAKAWCSTENVCPSVSYQRAVRRVVAPASRPFGSERNSGDSARPPSATRAGVSPEVVSPASRLYVFMSLRR